MKQTLIAPALAVAVAVLAGAPLEAQRHRGHWSNDEAMRVQIGEFEPRGDSTYWDDVAFDFTGDEDDFTDLAVGVSWAKYLGPRMGVQIGGLFYQGIEDLGYRDFVDDTGREIVHETRLETSHLTLGFLLSLVDRDAPIVPYIGAGGGLYLWNLVEEGDFIDFSGAELAIFDDFFEDDGEELGWYYLVGLEVPVSRSVRLFAEGRWDRAEADLGGDFQGLGELDLSGRMLSAGVSWSF